MWTLTQKLPQFFQEVNNARRNNVGFGGVLYGKCIKDDVGY